ncbi:MAG: PTS sugar transporter subunit IIC [Clostridium sp.]
MSVFQIILITLLAAWKKIDQKGPQIFIYNTVFWGALAGLIMGDVLTGLTIGATFQLMSLGVAAIGGTSVPDYQIGAIISIAIAVSTGKGVEAGIAVGLPVAMLAVQLDVLGNIAHGVFVRKAQVYAQQQKWSSFNMMYVICILITGLTTGLPTFLAVAFGDVLVTSIINAMPAWFTGGLSLAGKILPVVGFAVLLRYMPVKKNIEYLLIGFVFAAYLKVPVLGVAIIGAALAFKLYKDENKTLGTAVAGVREEQYDDE